MFYNLLLHPLRSFPGLWLWTAFRAPFSVSAIKGDLEHKIAEHHLRYGPVVRIAPDQLAFTDPAAWQDIYGMLPDRRQNQKDRYAYPRVIPDQDKGLVFANDDAHSRLRRLFSPAFSPRAVRQHEVTLLKQIEILIRELKQAIAKGGLQVVNGWYQRLIFDIAGEMVYGSSFRTLEIPELRPWMRSIAFAPEMGSVLAQLDRYGLWELIRVVGAPWLDPMIEKVFDYSNALADERAQRRSDAVTSDLFNRLVNNGEEGGAAALTRAELRINALIFLVATSATIATQLSVATWYLCASPIIHRRVKQEVRSSFRSDQEISVKAVNELTYLGAVLRETLRIVPPAAFGLSRVITSPGGQHIAGHHVPQGVSFEWRHCMPQRHTNIA